MRGRLALVSAFVLGQIALGLLVAVVQRGEFVPVGAAGSHNIRVGPGFTDVSPHQLVRSAADVLYVLAPSCDSYPSCPSNSLRIFRADQSGTPTSFTEQDPRRPPANVGSAALAIDSTNALHAVWNDRNGKGNVNYRTFSTATNTWSATTTLDTTNWTTFGQGDQGVALALDATGAPHVAYTTLVSGVRRVGYTTRVGGAWSTPTLVDTAPIGTNQGAWHPTLAFYPNGDLLLAWYVGSFNYTPDGTLSFRTRDHASGQWGSLETIAGDTLMTTIDNGPSLLITADGTAHVTFVNAGGATGGQDTDGDYIHYYYKVSGGSGWVANHPGGGRQITHVPSLGPAPGGGIRIYGHDWQGGPLDSHGENMNYFEGGGGASAWGSWTLYQAGGYDSSVSVRWAQFFQTHPEEIDVAYWADPYPNVLFVGTDVGPGGATPTATPVPTSTSVPPTSTPMPTATATPSPTATGTPGPSSTVLVGDQTIEQTRDSNPAGIAEAFQYVAAAGGTATRLTIYLDGSNTASTVVIGLYTNTGSNAPGALIVQATISNPTPGNWNSAPIPSVAITAGMTYWIAILGPKGSGVVQFRDTATGGRSQVSGQASLTTLPETWKGGKAAATAPLSAYAG